jgi:hypothetical protein
VRLLVRAGERLVGAKWHEALPSDPREQIAMLLLVDGVVLAATTLFAALLFQTTGLGRVHLPGLLFGGWFAFLGCFAAIQTGRVVVEFFMMRHHAYGTWKPGPGIATALAYPRDVDLLIAVVAAWAIA